MADPGYGGAGEGIGAAFSAILEDQRQQERAKRAAALTDAIKNAPDRTAAHQVASVAAANEARNTNDIRFIYSLVEQYHPEERPTAIRIITPENKQETRFVNPRHLERLNDPKEVERRFGPGTRMSQLEEEYQFFMPERVVPASPETGEEQTIPLQSMGKGPLSTRPKGARTAEELTYERQAFREEQEKERAAREVYRLGQADRRIDLQNQSLNRILERATQKDLDPNKIADNFRADTSTADRILARGLGRTLPDGSVVFDDDNKAQIYNNRLAMFGELLEQSYTRNPTGLKNISSMADRVIKAHPTTREKEGEPPPAPKKAETKTIGGKTYYHYGEKDKNGQKIWYTSPKR